MRRLLPALIGLLLVAAAPGVAAAEVQFGASISPAPLVVEDWDEPALTVVNSGTVAITATLGLSGDPGYRLALTHVALAPGEKARVLVARIGEGEAHVRVHVTNDEPGMDRQALMLETRLRHQTVWERWPVAQIALGALAGLVLLAWAARRVSVRRQAGRLPA